MRRGDFPAAWAVSDAVLAARSAHRAGAPPDDPAQPYHERWVWDGRAFEGRRVVVRCYHGLGDTLQFCRYLVPLRQRAAHVTLEVQPALAGLLSALVEGSTGGCRGRVVPFDMAAPIAPGEVDVEIMELAHALRLRPDPAPYLRAPLEAEGRARGGVGVCWAAGGWDPGRDMPAVALRPLLGERAVSLQRGPAADEGAALGLRDPLGGSMDMERLAALVAGLDAVVTVDTMVAHLAGALGRPVFVLLQRAADWRWGAGGRSDWYGSARLFRQQVAGGWAGPVRELSLSATFKALCIRMERT